MENTVISIFENKEFGKVRASIINGNPWFVAKDVCDSLGLSDVHMSISKLDDDEKLTQIILGSGGSGQGRKMWMINESGLYSLIFLSRKDRAKEFKRWITREVIPSIARTGMYFTESALDKIMSDPNTLFNIVKSWKEDHEKRLIAESERDVLKLEVKKKDSKLEHYEMITKSEHLLTITEVSKFFGTGPVVFCRLMRALKFHRKFRNHYELIQKYSDKNYGKVVEVPVLDENGDPIMWNKQLNYTRSGKEYVAHWWEKIGLISKNGSKQFVFNREKAKEILGLKTDEELDELEYEDNLI